MREIRWHARAGQGAKTASQLYAVAQMNAGHSVQAFPEYGPERRGAPMRAYTRIDDRPIRRHDAVTAPDTVVVLEPSLLRDVDVTEGLKPGGEVIVNSEDGIPADRIAAELGSKFVNLVMVGALAGTLGEPSLEQLVDSATSVLGKKVPAETLRAALTAGWEAACR
jgi:pyruvate ferredoxin oxidoreductase gamma subunit